MEDKTSLQQELLSLIEHNPQICLDVALDYAAAGFYKDAIELIQLWLRESGSHYPMLFYALASFSDKAGDHKAAESFRREAAAAPPDYCFPSRLEEMLLLQQAIVANPADSKAHYYLGNLLYDKKRYEEAIRSWERSVELNGSFSIPWRNLGIAYFNIRGDEKRAVKAYEKAFAVNPSDARLLYELDQLYKRIGTSPEERLARLEQHPELVAHRDDLTVEIITLYNQLERSEKALELLLSRRFNPWEGGEGLVSGQYVWAHILLGRASLRMNRSQEALAHFEAARNYPENLGEGKHLLTPEVHLDYFSGLALQQLGRREDARAMWARAAEFNGPESWLTYYRASALAALDRQSESRELIRQMRNSAAAQLKTKAKIDYFATSLPNLLLFEDDLQKRNRIESLFMLALAETAAGNHDRAATMNDVLALDPNHLAALAEVRFRHPEVAANPDQKTHH